MTREVRCHLFFSIIIAFVININMISRTSITITTNIMSNEHDNQEAQRLREEELAGQAHGEGQHHCQHHVNIIVNIIETTSLKCEQHISLLNKRYHQQFNIFDPVSENLPQAKTASSSLKRTSIAFCRMASQ